MMTEVPLWRLYLLRAIYAFMAFGIAMTQWPAIITHGNNWTILAGAARCLLGAIGLLALLGIRYPLRMLPLLIFEFVWKAIWFLAVARPLWWAGLITPEVMETVFACGMGVVLVPLVLPWRYVWANYVTAPGDRWR